MCDGKHTRKKVMNLNDQSDYSAPVKFKARNSTPKNYLYPLQTEEIKQWILSCPTRFGLNNPKRTSRGRIGPQDIGAKLTFGVNLALFILHCAVLFLLFFCAVQLMQFE